MIRIHGAKMGRAKRRCIANPAPAFAGDWRKMRRARPSEPLRRAEPDDARVEREDVGAEQGVVAVGKGVGDRCLVENVFDIELQRKIVRRPRERDREVDIVPSP